MNKRNLLLFPLIFIVLIIFYFAFQVEKNSEEEIQQESFESSEEYMLQEIKNCEDSLCIMPNSTINMKKGEYTSVFIKIKALAGSISCEEGPLNFCESVKYTVFDSLNFDAKGQLVLTGPGFKLNQGEEALEKYTLLVTEAPSTATYLLSVKLYPSSANEKTKTLSIKVE
jgi:hypothetical protein